MYQHKRNWNREPKFVLKLTIGLHRARRKTHNGIMHACNVRQISTANPDSSLNNLIKREYSNYNSLQCTCWLEPCCHVNEGMGMALKSMDKSYKIIIVSAISLYNNIDM